MLKKVILLTVLALYVGVSSIKAWCVLCLKSDSAKDLLSLENKNLIYLK